MAQSTTKKSCPLCKQSGHQSRTCSKAKELYGPDATKEKLAQSAQSADTSATPTVKLSAAETVQVRNYDGRGGILRVNGQRVALRSAVRGPRYHNQRYVESYRFQPTTPFVREAV